MNLQERIKSDLKTAMKEKNEAKKNTLRVVIGEFGRSDKKELPDDEVVKILKKLVKSEKEVLERKGETNRNSSGSSKRTCRKRLRMQRLKAG